MAIPLSGRRRVASDPGANSYVDSDVLFSRSVWDDTGKFGYDQFETPYPILTRSRQVSAPDIPVSGRKRNGRIPDSRNHATRLVALVGGAIQAVLDRAGAARPLQDRTLGTYGVNPGYDTGPAEDTAGTIDQNYRLVGRRSVAVQGAAPAAGNAQAGIAVASQSDLRRSAYDQTEPFAVSTTEDHYRGEFPSTGALDVTQYVDPHTSGMYQEWSSTLY